MDEYQSLSLRGDGRPPRIPEIQVPRSKGFEADGAQIPRVVPGKQHHAWSGYLFPAILTCVSPGKESNHTRSVTRTKSTVPSGRKRWGRMRLPAL